MGYMRQSKKPKPKGVVRNKRGQMNRDSSGKALGCHLFHSGSEGSWLQGQRCPGDRIGSVYLLHGLRGCAKAFSFFLSGPQYSSPNLETWTPAQIASNREFNGLTVDSHPACLTSFLASIHLPEGKGRIQPGCQDLTQPIGKLLRYASGPQQG